MKHVFGISLLAGIGFTVSIFIAVLAFPDAVSQTTAKLAVMAGSLVSAVAGYWFLAGRGKGANASKNSSRLGAILKSFTGLYCPVGVERFQLICNGCEETGTKRAIYNAMVVAERQVHHVAYGYHIPIGGLQHNGALLDHAERQYGHPAADL